MMVARTLSLVTIEMTCKHRVEFNSQHQPAVRENNPRATPIWCVRCQKMRLPIRIIKGPFPSGWWWKCLSCKSRGYGYGAARLKAQSGAVHHHTSHPEHTVQIWQYDEISTTLVAQQKLPDTDDPPF